MIVTKCFLYISLQKSSNGTITSETVAIKYFKELAENLYIVVNKLKYALPNRIIKKLTDAAKYLQMFENNSQV